MTIEQQHEEVDLTGVEAAFHQVVRDHGREMFATVYNAGMAEEATKVLAGLVEKHRSNHGAKALSILAASYNNAAAQVVSLRGWTSPGSSILLQ